MAAQATPAKEHHRRERFVSLLESAHVSAWWFAVGLVVLFAMLFVVLIYTHFFHYIRTFPVRWWFIPPAVLLIVGLWVGYAISLVAASSKRLPFGRVVALELGESVTAVATPEGIGSLALTMRFLRKHGYDVADAAAVTGLSSFVSTVTSMLLLPISIFFAAKDLNIAQLKADVPSGLWEVLAGILILAVLVTVVVKAPTVRARLISGARSAGRYLRTAIDHPWRASLIGVGELVTVAAEVGTLSFLLLAVRNNPHPFSLIVIVLLASTASSVVPFPGGLGAPEAILVAGLTSIGVDHVAALIAAISYRLLSYWLPPLPGIVFLRWLHRHNDF